MSAKLVLQTDFGLVDGAVAAMYGVALGVDETLSIHDLTHEIPPFDIFAASYRLYQTTRHWPAGTVFVSVVDPGVGSDRRSVAVQTDGGHIVITPDNGTLTHLARYTGIRKAREIDEDARALACGRESHTFHGRDIYACTGARLAGGRISFEQLGGPRSGLPTGLGEPHERLAVPLLAEAPQPRGPDRFGGAGRALQNDDGVRRQPRIQIGRAHV